MCKNFNCCSKTCDINCKNAYNNIMVIAWSFIIVIVSGFLSYIGYLIIFFIVILSNLDYNSTTGCPKIHPNCTNHMICYDNNSGVCYFISIFITSFATVSCIMLSIIKYNLCKPKCAKQFGLIINDKKKKLIDNNVINYESIHENVHE